jgi:hypothetical protein
VPPSGLVGLHSQPEEGGSFRPVDDAVKREQIGYIAFLEANSAEFEPTDLGVGRPDRPAGHFPADPAGLPKAA